MRLVCFKYESTRKYRSDGKRHQVYSHPLFRQEASLDTPML